MPYVKIIEHHENPLLLVFGLLPKNLQTNLTSFVTKENSYSAFLVKVFFVIFLFYLTFSPPMIHLVSVLIGINKLVRIGLIRLLEDERIRRPGRTMIS